MLMELNDTHPRNHECISRHPAGRTLSWWDVWPMLGSQAEIAMKPKGQTRGVPVTLDKNP